MLEFSQADKGVWLLKNGEQIHFFSEGDVFCEVGNGRNDFSMSHGSFKIREKIAERKELQIRQAELHDGVVELRLSEGMAMITSVNENVLRVSFSEELKRGYNRLTIWMKSDAREHVYGGGENFSEFDLKGKALNVWVAEHINAAQVAKKILKQCVGIRNTTRKQKLSKYETYYAQPTFLSSKKYFYHSTTTARAEFDFTRDEKHRIKVDQVADFYIGMGADYEAVLQELTKIVGRQPQLPDWVYDGQILGIQGGTDVMMGKVADALDAEMDICGVWIQDWEGRRVTAVGKQLYWNWQWDKELYPNLPDKIKELASRGIKVLGYCNPFLATEKELYQIASKKGYCVKDKDGNDYMVKITTFPAAMVDFTNPEAYDWIKGIIKENLIGLGMAGWMADFGEYLPTDAVLFSGEDPEIVHNTWPARWAQCNREAIEECGKLGEIMFFTRAGYSDTPKYSTMMWNGDNHVDFSLDFGLASVIPAMLSLTCCGYGISHSDIGGYTTFSNLRRSEELYLRWCEMNAFSPLMRGHEGLNPDLNVQFDGTKQTMQHSVRMGRIHKALKPYLKNAVAYNSEKGVGVVRPLFFYYEEEAAYQECYEYLLGRDMLVAPVVRPGETKRKVYLPQDKWIHLWSGKAYDGGTYTVDAPIGEIPVFVRKEAFEQFKDLQLNK